MNSSQGSSNSLNQLLIQSATTMVLAVMGVAALNRKKQLMFTCMDGNQYSHEAQRKQGDDSKTNSGSVKVQPANTSIVPSSLDQPRCSATAATRCCSHASPLLQWTTVTRVNGDIYEGETLRGRPHGKGKTMFVITANSLRGEWESVCHEGEYSKGLFEGPGKEFDRDGRIVFTGMYRQGKRWEGELNGFQMTSKGHHRLEGKLKAGLQHGYFKEYCIHKATEMLIFKGVYQNGIRSGPCTEYAYVQDPISGKQKLVPSFMGIYKSGKRWNGDVHDTTEGITFKGQLSNGLRFGKGSERVADTGMMIFQGEYLEGKRWNGEIEETVNGICFKGHVVSGLRNGQGSERPENGPRFFQGEYKDGKRWNGELFETIDGISFERCLTNGALTGPGREYDGKGRLLFKGEYLDGQRWNGEVFGLDSVGVVKSKTRLVNGMTKEGFQGVQKDSFAEIDLRIITTTPRRSRHYREASAEYKDSK